MRIGLFVVALTTAALVLPATVAAGPGVDIFQKHGLFGSWAVDCTRPPSVANPHIVYRPIDGGRVQRQISVELGKILDLSTIDSAVEASPTELIVSWKTGEGGITNRILLGTGRMQVQDSTRSNGQKLVVGGRRVTDNIEVPWYQRCGPPDIAAGLAAARVAQA